MAHLGDRAEFVEGRFDRRSFVTACFRGRRMVGAIGFNSPRSMLRYGELVAAANPAPVVAGAIGR
jgi:hypothetical protein